MPRGISKTIDELVEENDQLMTEVRQWMNEASKYQDLLVHEKNLNAFAFEALKEQLSQKDLLDNRAKTLQEELKGFVAQKQEDKQVIEQLQSQLDQAMTASNSLEASYEARIKELEEELNANKSDKQRLQEQVSQIKSRIAKITDTEEKEDIEDSLLLIEKEISRLKAESNKAEVQKLENKIAKLNNLVPENSRLKAQAKASEQAQWNALGRLAESQKENIIKDKTIRELQAKNNQLEKENAGVKTVERHSAYYKERLVIAEEKKNTATRMVAETKRENDELRKENSDLVDKNLDQKLKNKEQKAIIKKKGKILKFLGIGAGVLLVGGIVLGVFTGKLNKDNKDKIGTIQNQEVTIQDQEDTIKNQEDTIGEITQENKDLTEENGGLIEENTGLTQENKDLTEENNGLIEENAGLKQENENKQEIIDSFEITNIDFEKLNNESKAIYQDIKTALADKKGSVQNITMEYQASTGTVTLTYDKFNEKGELVSSEEMKSIKIETGIGSHNEIISQVAESLGIQIDANIESEME